jgi:hypothetical protein
MLHGGGDHIELRLGHDRLVDDVAPAPEADKHMRFHPIIALERPGELGTVGDGDGFSVRQAPHLIGGPECGAVLAEKHARKHHQMKIVTTAQQIARWIVRISEVEIIGANRLLAGDFCLFIVPAQHIDMGGHVIHMSGVRTYRTEYVRRPQRALGHARHFEQMNVQVKNGWVLRRASLIGKPNRALANMQRFERVGAGSRRPGLQIP